MDVVAFPTHGRVRRAPRRCDAQLMLPPHQSAGAESGL